MNITYAIPKGKKNYKSFIKHELGQAHNIKDKNTRQQTEAGLRSMLNQASDGQVHLWNGEKLWTHEYPLNDTIYHCGKKFIVPQVSIDSQYLMVIVDANNATIGKLTGKKITKLWEETSNVMGKHGKGGQSKERFQRDREEQLKRWFRKVSRKLKEYV